MFRALFKLILFLIMAVLAAGFFLGWWGNRATLPERDTVATAGRQTAERAKEIGSQLGLKVAVAAKQAQEVLSDSALTAKIKAKMALDDSVKALNLHVETTDRVTTVSGTVRSEKERERALQLARETDGVKQVIDRTTREGPR
jgi:hyperosmotically inducible periplasmic protein